MHEAIKPTCGFYVAVNNAMMRKLHAKGNGCLYLMGNRAIGNVLIIRNKGPAAQEKERGNALTLGQAEMRY